MKIVFPEFNHPIIQQALAEYNKLYSSPQLSTSIEPISAPDLTSACNLVKSGAADAMIAGIDYSSRDVILACREHFGMGSIPVQLIAALQVEPNSTPDNPATSTVYSTFSGLAVMERQKPDGTTETYLLADMAACKHPTEQQLLEIVAQTITSATKILPDIPRVALLSFSTAGSGGRDDTITLMQNILAKSQPLSKSSSTFFIDGEMQLDAALNPRVGEKKFPTSKVAGQANALIVPDLNSGNLLYKSFEQLAGFTVAGPILQGFNFPVSDLSRGSTVNDVILTIKTIARLAA